MEGVVVAKALDGDTVVISTAGVVRPIVASGVAMSELPPHAATPSRAPRTAASFESLSEAVTLCSGGRCEGGGYIDPQW